MQVFQKLRVERGIFIRFLSDQAASLVKKPPAPDIYSLDITDSSLAAISSV